MPPIRKDDTMEFPSPTQHHHQPASPLERYAIIIGILVLTVLVALVCLFSGTAEARTSPWQRAQASYYTLFGNRTACGQTASSRAWFIASLKSDTANCGRKIRLCHKARCVNVTVQDRGAWRWDNRRWDLQVRVRDALRCGDLCTLRWKHGW